MTGHRLFSEFGGGRVIRAAKDPRVIRSPFSSGIVAHAGVATLLKMVEDGIAGSIRRRAIQVRSGDED